MPDQAGPDTDDRIPVTVLTGWLGAGKTTVLNHLLATADGQRLAVIVNEFGDIGIDGTLIDAGPLDLIELNSGCLCCVVRGDLIRSLKALAARDGSRPDAVVIETTGVAHPAPVLQTFLADQVLAGHFRLDAVVTVADAVHLPATVALEPDAADQLVLADVVVLNKLADATDGGTAAEICVAAHAPFATLLKVDRGRVPAAALLGRHAFDAATLATRLADLSPRTPGPDAAGHQHHRNDGPAAHALTVEGPFDPVLLADWLDHLLEAQGDTILRIKGILPVAGEGMIVLQSVHRMTETAPAPAGALAQDAPGRIVLIGRGIEPLAVARDLAACRGPKNGVI